MKTLKIKVEGRVQGVNFRNTIQKFALGIGIRGWVKNNKDGSVSIVAQADKKTLEDLLEWLEDSPGFSNVKNIAHEWISAPEYYESFTVKRESSFLKDQMNSMHNLSRNIK